MIHDLGFDFGVVAVGALIEPVGPSGGADEFGFVLGVGVIGVDVVTMEPTGFESEEVFHEFMVEDESGGGAGAVLERVAGGNVFSGF